MYLFFSFLNVSFNFYFVFQFSKTITFCSRFDLIVLFCSWLGLKRLVNVYYGYFCISVLLSNNLHLIFSYYNTNLSPVYFAVYANIFGFFVCHMAWCYLDLKLTFR